jgi:hypothetical protein
MAEYDFELEELDSEGEFSEKAAPKRPPSSSSYKPRPSGGTPPAVTQAQLEAALSRVDGKIKTVADGVSTISSRVNALSATAKKEAEARKKGVDNTSKDLNQKLQMLALLPLLIQTPTATLSVPLATTGGGTVTQIATPDPNGSLDSILPLLLVSGLGSSGTSGGLSLDGSGSDGGILLLALALAFANPNRQ